MPNMIEEPRQLACRTPAQRRRYRRRTRKWAVEAGQHLLALVRPAPISRDAFLRRRAFWHVSGAALAAPTVTARGTNEFACQVSEADFVRINLTGCHQQDTTYRIQQVIDNVVDVRADLDLLPVQSSSQPNFSMPICDQQTNQPLPSSLPAPVSVSGLPAPTPAERASPASDHKIGFGQAAPIRDYLLFFSHPAQLQSHRDGAVGMVFSTRSCAGTGDTTAKAVLRPCQGSVRRNDSARRGWRKVRLHSTPPTLCVGLGGGQ